MTRCHEAIMKTYVKPIVDIKDEEGLGNAYEAKDGLYQHCKKLLIAGTRDFPQDHTDGFKQMSDTLKK